MSLTTFRMWACPMTRVEAATTPTMAADTSNPARCTDVATNTETPVQPLKGQLDIYGGEA